MCLALKVYRRGVSSNSLLEGIPQAVGWLSAPCFSQLHHTLFQIPDEKGVLVTNVDIVLVLATTPGVESRPGLS